MKILYTLTLLCALSTLALGQGSARSARGTQTTAKATTTDGGTSTDDNAVAEEEENPTSIKEKPSTTGIRFIGRSIDNSQIPEAYMFHPKAKQWVKVKIANNPLDRYPLNGFKVTLYKDKARPEKKIPDVLATGEVSANASNRLMGMISMKEGKANISFFDEAEYYAGGIHFVSTVPNLSVKIIVGDNAPIEVKPDSPLHVDYRSKASGEMVVAVHYKTPNGKWNKLANFIAQSTPSDSKISIITWDEKRKRPRLENYILFDERSNYDAIYNPKPTKKATRSAGAEGGDRTPTPRS